MSADDAMLPRILAFLDAVGIPVVAEHVTDSLLPGMTVRRGTLVYDPDRLVWPGDLLHEAGHIAITDPALRTTQESVSDSPAEEMAAHAWCYAATVAIGLDPASVFHEDYAGGGASILGSFQTPHPRSTGGIGVPYLQLFGMSGEPQRAAALGLPVFPAMTRWLR